MTSSARCEYRLSAFGQTRATMPGAVMPGAVLARMVMAGVLAVFVCLWAGGAIADSQRSYLDLSHDMMRRQLASYDLAAASRTLDRLRRVHPDHDVTAVLAAELQLRRGHVALAAMTLTNLAGSPASARQAVLEANRVLNSLADSSGPQDVIVSGEMLHRVLSAAETGRQTGPIVGLLQPADRFGYTVRDLPRPLPTRIWPFL